MHDEKPRRCCHPSHSPLLQLRTATCDLSQSLLESESVLSAECPATNCHRQWPWKRRKTRGFASRRGNPYHPSGSCPTALCPFAFPFLARWRVSFQVCGPGGSLLVGGVPEHSVASRPGAKTTTLVESCIGSPRLCLACFISTEKQAGNASSEHDKNRPSGSSDAPPLARQMAL